MFKNLERNGFHTSSIHHILSCSGLSQYDINDPDRRLSFHEHHLLIDNISKHKELSHILSSTPIFSGDINATGYALFPEFIGLCLNGRNLQDALNTAIGHRAIIGNRDDFFVLHSDDKTMIQYEELNPYFSNRMNLGSAGNLFSIVALIRFYDARANIHVYLKASNPQHQKFAQEVLGCHCSINQNKDCIIVDSKILAIENPAFNPALHRIQQDCINTLQHDIAANEASFSAMVGRLIRTLLQSERISHQCDILIFVCDTLRLSRWTLNKRLQMEATSFSSLLDNVRLELSIHLLHHSELSMSEIGEKLIFSSSSSFTRFFKNSTGHAPLSYRTRHKEHR